jgi:hypothetical protein
MYSIASNSSAGFPLKSSLWRGSVLTSIAHAIFIARAPSLSHEQSWNGRDYSVQDSHGSRGTVAFGDAEDHFVALFFRTESGPVRGSGVDLFLGMPGELRTLAERATDFRFFIARPRALVALLVNLFG